MKEIKSHLSKGDIVVEVQRLTKGQMLAIGLMNNIPEGEARIVAFRRNKNGEVVQGKIVKGVDEKRFLHEEDEYYDQVLKQARGLFNSK